MDRLKTGFDALPWFYGKSKKIDSKIESPGISFIGMTQLSTFVPKVYYNMMGSGGLFDRTLIVVNPNPSRLVPTAKAQKIAELNQFEEQDLK